MTPDPARKLIEEALREAGDTHVEDLLRRALSLLPEWQEFDPEREETWPKEGGAYLVQEVYGHPFSRVWHRPFWGKVVAYQPLPPPYVKP